MDAQVQRWCQAHNITPEELRLLAPCHHEVLEERTCKGERFPDSCHLNKPPVSESCQLSKPPGFSLACWAQQLPSLCSCCHMDLQTVGCISPLLRHGQNKSRDAFCATHDCSAASSVHHCIRAACAPFHCLLLSRVHPTIHLEAMHGSSHPQPCHVRHLSVSSRPQRTLLHSTKIFPAGFFAGFQVQKHQQRVESR